MAKFYGPIGYAKSVEVTPGVWRDEITEHNCTGEILKSSTRWTSSSDSTNDDLTLNNQISILADPYACQNSSWMKYVRYMGINWKITNVEVQYPRLILTVGGVYNGKTAT